MNIDCRLLKFASMEYWATVALRYEVLRKPLNLDYTYTQLMSEDSDFHIGGYINMSLVGCLILTPSDEGKIKMRQVAVDETWQGKGVGKAMVVFSEEFSKENGFTEMILHARETAIPFYLSMDYEIYDEPFTEVGIPHRKMRKAL